MPKPAAPTPKSQAIVPAAPLAAGSTQYVITINGKSHNVTVSQK
jgi:hypothetical protein